MTDISYFLFNYVFCNSFTIEVTFIILFQTETKGLTGLVKFDRNGFRSNIALDIVRLTENGLIKIGEWNSTTGENIDWLPEINIPKSDFEQTIQNRTLIVLISLTKPYGMQKESTTTLSGNDRYEGFAIDIIDEISKELKFNYTLEVEGDYGKKSPTTGKWSGMLGKIMDGVSIEYQKHNQLIKVQN